MNAETKTTDFDANSEIFVADFSDLITCQQRVTAFCRWFDLPDPGLRYDEDGDILVDDVFLRWCKDEGISIDWLVCGDPKGMAAVFRERQRGRNQMELDIAELDEDEVEMFAFAIRAYVKNTVPLDQAKEVLKKCIEEYREETKAA